MPALTIETQPDGSVLVAPATQPLDPQTAERFPSMADAMTAVQAVLGEDEQGPGEQSTGSRQELTEEAGEGEGKKSGEMEEGGEAAPAQPGPTGDSLQPTAPAEMEADMAKGYNRARKGR